MTHSTASNPSTSDPATAAPLPRTGAQILVQALLDQGVEVLFGYPGGAIMPTYDALLDVGESIRHVLVRHEQGAAHAAEGYSRATGKVGVCLATSGPGATNMITALADAMLDSTPLVCITGQVASHLLGTDAFQESDVIGMTIPATKWSYQITDAAEIPMVVARAFEVARTGRPGPVLIDMPKDVQETKIVPEWDAAMRLPGYSVDDRHARPEQVRQVAAAIKLAKRPIIYCGGGIIAGEASDGVLAD